MFCAVRASERRFEHSKNHVMLLRYNSPVCPGTDESGDAVSESEFDSNVRLWLHKRYFPFGQWENNKTGYRDSYHSPLGGKGGADLVGWLGPLHIEIENKSIRGRVRPEQKLRRERMTKPWGPLYVVCRESGEVDANGVDTGFDELLLPCIDEHACRWLLPGRACLQTMGIKSIHGIKEVSKGTPTKRRGAAYQCGARAGVDCSGHRLATTAARYRVVPGPLRARRSQEHCSSNRTRCSYRRAQHCERCYCAQGCRQARAGGRNQVLAELLDTNAAGATSEDAKSWARGVRQLWEKRCLLAEARSLAALIANGAVEDPFEAFERSLQRVELLKPNDEDPLGFLLTELGDLNEEPGERRT